MEKADIEKLETLGYVADSRKIREELITQLHNKTKDLETIQKELKEIKKTAKKKGLFTNDELHKKKYTLEEAINIAEKQKIIYSYNNLSEKLPNKNKQKRNKI